MTRSYSVAQARAALPKILRAVEGGEPVEITRRGKPVAVLVSRSEYDVLLQPRQGFASAYDAWRRSLSDEDLAGLGDAFEPARDPSPGRDIDLAG